MSDLIQRLARVSFTFVMMNAAAVNGLVAVELRQARLAVSSCRNDWHSISGGLGRTLRGPVGWVKAPDIRHPAGCRRALPSADREAELGLLGRLRVHGAALLPPAGHGAGAGAAAPAGARRHRRARRHGRAPARHAVCRSCASRPRRSASACMALVMVGDDPLLGLARRRAQHVHRRLLQSRARLPPDGQQRQEHQGAASAVVADPLRRWATSRRAACSTSPPAPTSSRASGCTDRSRA